MITTLSFPEKRIGDFAQVKGGKRLPAGTALTAKITSHPYLRIVDFHDGGIDTSNLMYVPDDVFPSIARYIIHKSDIYISIVGTVGLVGLIPDELNGANLTENAARICNISDEVNRDFLFYFLKSRNGQDQISALSVGSTQPKLALFRIEEIKVPVPPLAKQKRIAHILGTLDDKIELNRRMNATLEAIAQALFKSWFVDFDPVRAKASGEAEESICQRLGLTREVLALFPDRLMESELGEIPAGWRQGTIKDIAENPRRGTDPKTLSPETPYIGLEHMPRRSIALGDWGEASEAESTKSKFESGEILFGKLRPYFHKVGVAITSGICSTDILVIKPSKKEWFGLLLCHLSSEALIDFVTAASEGTRMPRTSWPDVGKFPIAIPDFEITKSFTSLMNPVVEQIRANLYEEKTLSALRDTLLPKLLSGELSVSEAGEVVEAVV